MVLQPVVAFRARRKPIKRERRKLLIPEYLASNYHQTASQPSVASLIQTASEFRKTRGGNCSVFEIQGIFRQGGRSGKLVPLPQLVLPLAVAYAVHV